MVNTLFKECIYYIDYAPILYIIIMMESPRIYINSIKKIRKCGENLQYKPKFKVVRNDSKHLGYMEGSEPGYSWTD